MSNFCYKDAKGNIIQVPVRFGDISRQMASIINKNTENIIQSAPFIACYISDIKYDRSRIQDPTFVGKLHIRERAFDKDNNEYLNIQGANYTVERLMPTPYNISFKADLWTTNYDQKLQLWEQIAVLFNPSFEIQTSDNYIDWTSLSVLELTEDSRFESRSIPQGANTGDLSIATFSFTAPAWISAPIKVKKLGIITKIIANIFAEPAGTGDAGGYEDAFKGGDIFGGLPVDSRVVVTSGDYGLLVIDNTASLIGTSFTENGKNWENMDQNPNKTSWFNLLERYPGNFKSGLSQIRLSKDTGGEIVAYISVNPTNDNIMNLIFDEDTLPANTLINERGTIDAIVNPETFKPTNTAVNTRYLLLEPIVATDIKWKNYDGTDVVANENDIIEWNGEDWIVVFDSKTVTDIVYITNSFTGIQYKWDGTQWLKSVEGVYDNYKWRLVL